MSFFELLQDLRWISMRNSCPPEDWCRSHKNHKIWAKLPNPQVRKPNNPKAATERETRRFGQCDFWIFQELIFLTRSSKSLQSCCVCPCKTQLRCRMIQYQHRRVTFVVSLQRRDLESAPKSTYLPGTC